MTKRAVWQRLVSLGFLALACGPGVALAEGGQLDLGDNDVVDGSSGYKVRGAGAESYLLTGIPRQNRDTHTLEYLAVSRINAVKAPKTVSSTALFSDQDQRPLTWNEADAGCRGYQLAGKSWRLPNKVEVQQLNNFLQFKKVVLDAKKGETTVIAGNYAKLNAKFDDLFQYFWMSDENPTLGAGLKVAGSFDGGTIQSMSVQRPLSVICVTYLSGPATPFVVAARARGVTKDKVNH